MSPYFRHHLLLKTVKVTDLVIVCVAFLAALAVSYGSFTWPSLAQVLVIRISVANIVLFIGYVGLCAIVFSASGFYRSDRLSGGSQGFRETFGAVTFLTGVLIVLRSPLALAFATNRFLVLFALFSLCLLVLSRATTRRLFHLSGMYGRNLRNIIVIGEEPGATALANHIRQETSLGYRVLRVIDAGEMRD
jgi:FlaA1/EpsC-like NDP-sugar epimerase